MRIPGKGAITLRRGLALVDMLIGVVLIGVMVSLAGAAGEMVRSSAAMRHQGGGRCSAANILAGVMEKPYSDAYEIGDPRARVEVSWFDPEEEPAYSPLNQDRGLQLITVLILEQGEEVRLGALKARVPP